jgi:hypothetical protein
MIDDKEKDGWLDRRGGGRDAANASVEGADTAPRVDATKSAHTSVSSNVTTCTYAAMGTDTAPNSNAAEGATPPQVATPSIRGIGLAVPKHTQTTAGQASNSQSTGAHAMGSGSRSGCPFRPTFRRSDM